VQERDGWYPKRDQAYIGVLVDDLITRGTAEPYRMFTSRAEYRLMLREDNADLRLSEIAHDMNLLSDDQWRAFNEKREAIVKETQRLRDIWVAPNSAVAKELAPLLETAMTKESRALDLLRRPELDYAKLSQVAALGPFAADPAVAEQVETQIKYEGYLERQQEEIERARRQENSQIPDDFDYTQVRGLSNEVRQKLIQHKPVTLGQAGRISGVTPAAISLLTVHLKKSDKQKSA
jgi:tRNA uridine 5-carboxymethylaminomethyl modification enzyme